MQLGLDYKSSLSGLGFDGVSVMGGRSSSAAQKRISVKVPLSCNVYCYGHKLNLMLTSVVKHVL